jgi:3-oxoacyl-[acyl-carrier protein] reductase
MGNTKSVAIITGASQGIGRATALRLACDFSVIVLVARNKDNLDKTATEVTSLGAETMVHALDLRQPQSAKTIIDGTLERFGKLD